MSEQLTTLAEQRRSIDKELTDRLEELVRLVKTRFDLDTRILQTISMTRVDSRIRGSMTPVQGNVLDALSEVLRKDSDGKFTSELERILKVRV